MRKLIIGLLCASCIVVPPKVKAGEDIEIWNQNSIQFRLSDTTAVTVEEEGKYDDDFNAYYYHGDIGLTTALDNNLLVGINYRHVWFDVRDDWEEEYRPHAHLTFRGKVESFNLSNRNRFEYRIFEDDDKDEQWRYRNKTTVELSRFFVSDELFFDIDEGTWDKNRLRAGVNITPFDEVDATVYYQNEMIDPDGDEDYIHGVGLALEFKI